MDDDSSVLLNDDSAGILTETSPLHSHDEDDTVDDDVDQVDEKETVAVEDEVEANVLGEVGESRTLSTPMKYALVGLMVIVLHVCVSLLSA